MKNVSFVFLFFFVSINSNSQSYDIKYHIDFMLYLIDDGRAVTEVGLMDTKGNILKEKVYSNAAASNDVINIAKDGVFGYLDGNNKERYFPKFKKAFWDKDGGIAVNEEKRFALIDLEGRLKTDYLFKEIRRVSKDYYYVTVNGKGNYISLDGKFVFDSKYNMSDQGVNNGVGCYISDNKKNGFLNIGGAIVSEPIYDIVYGAENSDCWVVRQNGKFGILDKNCKILIPISYDKIDYVPEKGALIAVEVKKKYGYINKKNQVVIPFIYNKALPFIDGYAIVNKDGNYGYINEKNQEIAFFGKETFWIGEDYFNDGLAIFKVDGKYGFIDKKGKIVVPAQYENVENFNKGMALVMKDKKYGFINTKGEVIIPLHYSYLSNVNNDKILFQQ